MYIHTCVCVRVCVCVHTYIHVKKKEKGVGPYLEHLNPSLLHRRTAAGVECLCSKKKSQEKKQPPFESHMC